MPLKPGDRIERYVIDAPLGHGGMGEVYRAHDERLQRSVALKILLVDASASEGSSSRSSSEGAARMLREARAAAALDHPNVVAIYDVGQVTEPEELRGTTYLAMELIKGKTLRTYVGDARVTLKERLRWLTEIARALGAAHAAGLVHRDVKPENVMIRDGGSVKVLDFGIAKRTANSVVDPTSSTEGYVVPTATASGVVMGTPLYMAPEQLRGEALDGRADQFGWGVLAYELIAGRLPWTKDAGAITLVSQILSTTPPPFDAQLEVPVNVSDAVMRALSKDPAQRFTTMDQLLELFEGPVSPLAKTAAYVATSTAKSASLPSGSAPQVIVSRHPPATPGTERGPTTVPSAEAAPSARRRRWRVLAGVLAVAGGVAVVALGAREQAKRRAAVAAAASVKAAAVVGCTGNGACAAEHGGEPYVCRASDHTCVAIASEDCKAMYEPRDLTSDDTLWLGAMFPMNGPMADVGNMNMDGVDFARTEIAQAVDSLEGSSIGRKVRRVALVACDDSENARRVARHLVDDVGVPAILGFRSGQELIDLAGSLLIDRGVVVVASLTSNPLITRLPQPTNEPRLVWRTTYGYEALAEAAASFVHDTLEPRQTTGGHRTRLLLLRNASVANVAFADVFYRHLVFNGKPAVENRHDYQEIVLDSKDGSATEEAERQIRQAAPTIIVDVGAPPALVPAIEADLSGTANPPTYAVVNDTTSNLAPFIGSSAERRHHVFAISAASSSTPLARFVIRYDQARHKNLTRDLNPSSSYDAFYLLSYASFALPLGAATVTGGALAGRFSHLVGPGKSIDVGPTGVFDALTILSSGGTIDLEGVATGLDFDLSTGEAPCDFALFCPAVDDRGRANGEDLESGVVYHQKTHRSEGTLRCQ